ncbi:MAG: cob(I)yrinic acid a,c-diamide adenosyltransferase [Nanoarchaeota archaeon]|nr:cob(I)yrinic acid a,c-diamide adenosyltransferase [Nanoarchaeota archaeon]
MEPDKSNLGHLSIFWGNGKGKSTSAFGTAVRALGNGYNVHLVQFMKNGASSLEQQIPGEIHALERFPNFSYKRFGIGSWVTNKNKQEHLDSVKETLNYLKSTFNEEHDIIIADEILYAIQLGLLQEQEVIDLIECRPKNKDLILTGSHIPYPNIFEKADLVTEIKKIKHPYDKGILARKGLEF